MNDNDDIVNLLGESIEIIHAQNTGRASRCMSCGLSFVGPGSAQRHFEHIQAHQAHADFLATEREASKRKHPSSQWDDG